MLKLQNEFDGLPDFQAAEITFTPETEPGSSIAGNTYFVSSSQPAGKDGSLESIVKNTEAFFDPETGALRDFSKHSGREYEFRAGQMKMAESIASALVAGKNLVIEAPTGIGKSFAYLVPLVYWSQLLPHPAVVSTGTIHLQEQLIKKDLPMLAKLTGIPFKTAIAKGRSNYLCLRRLDLALSDAASRLFETDGLGRELKNIAQWSRSCSSGDRDEPDVRFDPRAWNLAACEANSCMSNRCPHFKRCFYWKARLSWDEADIIVANHALFFANMKLENEELADAESAGGGILPRFSAVVIDEAHTLEDAAADHLGLQVSELGLLGYLNRLFNPDTGHGLLLKSGVEMQKLRAMVVEMREKAKLFFKIVGQFLAQVDDTVREVKEEGLFPDILSSELREFRLQLLDVAAAEKDESIQTELEGAVVRVGEYADALSVFIQRSMGEYVYWVEKDQDCLVLHGAPLNVADLLCVHLFRRSYPVVLTSATLQVNGRFDYYTKRIGYEGEVPVSLESPFSPEQVQLYLPDRLPDPAHQDYLNMLLYFIPRCINVTGGGSLVLFTSYSLLQSCARELEKELHDAGYPLLVQDGTRSRSVLLREFRNTPNAVLFGTDSFWTGVDVPGEALRNVIVTKLPFAVPTQPLIKARCEKITADGGNSFMEYSVPEAILKLRQGIGRLIRTSSDKGMITILDSRVLTKRYGNMFLRSLPQYPRVDFEF